MSRMRLMNVKPLRTHVKTRQNGENENPSGAMASVASDQSGP